MKILRFIKREIVLVISFLLAMVSAFIVVPDSQYISYIDFRTLSILFSLMLVMSGLSDLGVFSRIGETLISRVKSYRGIVIVLTMLCFFFSMLITNDVALITFVPFTIIVFNLAGMKDKLIITIVLETVAANLGSMITPIGNPQNLYLYSLSGLGFGEFIILMLPYGVISLVLILAGGFVFSGRGYVETKKLSEYNLGRNDKLRILVYALIFICELLVVVRILDYRIGFVIAVVLTMAAGVKNFKNVDYSLLFTFIFLFIFIGNLKRIPAVSDLLMSITNGREVIVSALASQVISNVPAAILLSGFTKNITALIVGTNLGGLGTLIASMASLISFKLYSKEEGSSVKKYIISFTLINVVMLVVLGSVALLGIFA